MNTPKNCIVLDLETARSAEDCRHCGRGREAHLGYSTCGPLYDERGGQAGYAPLGWDDKAALGLSIGCYWDYTDQRIYWFDMDTLAATVQLLVERQPLLVSFNGIGFDFPLMRALLQREDDTFPAQNLAALCDVFERHCAASYDLLAEIWKIDPGRKFERGLNSLDAIAQANGLAAKLSHGAQAPRNWAAGRYAQVLNYCQDDVYKTKALFELVCAQEQIRRGDGTALTLPLP